MEETKSTILIVEDDLDIAEMLNAYFRVHGYEVVAVNWGEDGVRASQSHAPDLVILDIRLPDIDGFEVARRLRSNRKTRAIPIIFLTEKRERSDRLRGLELQADDYVTKPFEIHELRLRVQNALRRAHQGSLTNPVTALPEGVLVDEALESCLNQSDRVFMVITLKNINRFREVYGFVASDDLLRAVALMVQEAVQDLCEAGDFLGHLAASTFVVTTHPRHVDVLRKRIHKRLEHSFDYFYSDKDREQGTFGNKRLAVEINDIPVSALPQRDLSGLKKELEKTYH